MGTKRRFENRGTAFLIASSLGSSLLLVLAYVGIWKWVAPGYYLFLVLGTYWLLGGSALWQLLRVARMDHWSRRLGAIGVPFGFAVTIFLGLRPRTACLDTGPCLSGLTPHPLQVALGLILVTASLFLDVRNATNLSASE